MSPRVAQLTGAARELVYQFIRKGGKLRVYARWIEGDQARTRLRSLVLPWSLTSAASRRVI